MIENVEEIKKLRKKLGLTQKELSKISGVSQSAIAKIESGIMDPGFSVAKKLHDAMQKNSDSTVLKAKDIMKSPVTTISLNCKIEEVVALMKKKNYSQFPITNGNQVVGSISDNNLLDAIMKKDAKLNEIMSEAPPTVSKETPVEAIVGLLRHFPLVLVSEKGKSVGIITKTDVLIKQK